MGKRSRERRVLLLPFFVMLIAQYAALFISVTALPSNTPLCMPSHNGAAWRGWNTGTCLTEEQVWCRANGNKHANCATADCRAEEIRMTLANERVAREPVYGTCAVNVYDHIVSMNSGRGQWNSCGVCVPSNDRRAAYLPECDEATARCRGLYWLPTDASGFSDFDCASSVRNVGC
jgi:hypothetical protein